MSFIELHVVFFVLGLLLLIVEVVLGMALGVALSVAITFFLLGLASWMNLISAFNNFLMAGAVIFLVTTAGVLKYFKSRARHQPVAQQDVNDY